MVLKIKNLGGKENQALLYSEPTTRLFTFVKDKIGCVSSCHLIIFALTKQQHLLL